MKNSVIEPGEYGKSDRVRNNTADEINQRLDQRAEDRVLAYAGGRREEITSRIGELEREWSIERVIETEASAMGLTGLAFGIGINRKFLALPAFVASMVLLHAVQGWYPLLPLFRRLGVRTRQEIDREKFALKTLRGDFGDAAAEEAAIGPAAEDFARQVAAAFRAVRA